jgi:hypothetical protein
MLAMLAVKHVTIACALLASATTALAERLLSPYSWCGDCNLDICTDNEWTSNGLAFLVPISSIIGSYFDVRF